MTDEFEVTTVSSPQALSLRQRVSRAIKGVWQDTPPAATTTLGISSEQLEKWYSPFFKLSRERMDVYRDVKQMDETVDEVATALDMMADNAVAPDWSGSATFGIAYTGEVSDEVKAEIDAVVLRTKWREKAYQICRGMMLMGDDFEQVVVDNEDRVVRLMYMPPASMVRNEDAQGLLMNGHEVRTWAYEQYVPDSERFVAGFEPWQIIHLRWNRAGDTPYGRSLIGTARTSWRKLQAMEEALVINWITRAFARLLFTLDVTGKPEKEAEKAIRKFLASLQTRRIAKDVRGIQQLSVVTDIAIGNSYHEIGGKAEAGLTDVKVLDTSSSGFQNLNPIEYYRGKILMSLRTPKAYLNLEQDINAKATLLQEDRRYTRFIRRIQSVLSEGIAATINIQLALLGVDPTTIPYVINWPIPGWSDVVEDAQALELYTRADQSLLAMGMVDKDFIAQKHLRLGDTEWQAMKERIGKLPPGNQDDTGEINDNT